VGIWEAKKMEDYLSRNPDISQRVYASLIRTTIRFDKAVPKYGLTGRLIQEMIKKRIGI